MKNITLSADDRLLARARAYAKEHNKTLNQLIRDYLAEITGDIDPTRAAEEFARLATTRAGRSVDDSPFDRESLHERGG